MSETPEKTSLIRSWLQLVRFPAVFTAMSDIFLGFLLTHKTLEPINQFFFLLGSSCCLYLSGMLFNDVFDRRVDLKERPNRPIPSGRISLKAAILAGVLLMAGGLGFALLNDLSQTVKSYNSSFIVGILILAIFSYDFLLKKTVMGPVAMGCCRFLNVMLGASASVPVWTTPQLYLAGCLGIFIVGLTWFARNETEVNRPSQLIPPCLVINIGLTGLLLYIARSLSPELATTLAPLTGSQIGMSQAGTIVLFLGFVILILNRRLLVALRDPVPKRIQHAVKSMLLSYIVLNSTIILYQTGNISLALITILLLVPATILSRWIFMT